VGATQSGNIAYGQIDNYTFSGSVGQRLYFDGLSGSNGLYATLSQFNGAIDNISLGNDAGPVTLTDAGTYILSVSSSNGTSSGTGPYSFRLLDVASAAALSLTISNSGTIDPGTGTVLYTLNGTAGQRIQFTWGSGTGGSYYLYGENNNRLASASFGNGFQVTLPVSGLYVLALVGGSGSPISYSFQAADDSDQPAAPSGFGTVHSGTLAGGANTTFTYTAPAGRTVYFDSQTYNPNILFSLSGPDGSTTFSGYNYYDYGPVALPRSGTYTLTLTNGSGSSQSYAFRLLDLQEGTTAALTLGQTVSSTSSAAYTADVYSFTGSVGQQLYYDGLSDNSTSIMGVQLIGPSGESVFSDSTRGDQSPVTLTEAGTYYLIQSNNGSATPSYSFRLMDVSSATPLSFGTTTSGTLNGGPSGAGTSTDLYSFTGNAGQRLYFHALTGSGGTYYLYDPVGQQVTASNIGNDFAATLGVAGTYLLAVQGYYNNTSPVSYSFQALQPSTNTSAYTLGTTQSGNIAFGQIDNYTFTGSVGQRLYFDGLSGANYVYATLTSPSGANAGLNNTDLRSDVGPITLTEAGTYILSVSSYGGTYLGTGAYSFRLLDASSATPLSLGTATSGTLNGGPSGVGTSTNLYSFTGAAGQRLYFHAISGTSGDYYLYGPTGQQVASSYIGSDFAATLPTSGIYLLAVQGSYNNTAAVSYSFQTLQPSTNTSTYTLGTTQSGNIAFGQIDNYTFTGSVGQRLYFDGLEGSSNLNVTLTSPSGVNAGINYYVGYDDGPITLSESGTYTLSVSSNNGTGNSTGAYSFRLLDVSSAFSLGFGTTTSGTLNGGPSGVGTSTNLDSFTAAAGQRLYFQHLTGSNANYYLYGPTGQQLAGSYIGSDFAATLPTSGIYLLALQGYYYNSSPVSYSFQTLQPSTNTSAYTLGTTQSGNIAFGQIDNYTFTGSVGQRLYFDGLLGSGNLFATLTSPSGAITGVNYYVGDDQGPFTLSESGTYTLSISSNNGTGNSTGAYSFRLLDLGAQPEILTGAVFTVTLSQASASPVTVQYATQDNTAIAGTDYVARSGSLVFNSGQTSETIPIYVLPDPNTANSITFFVNLSNPSGATITNGQGVGTIINPNPVATSLSFVEQPTDIVAGAPLGPVQVQVLDQFGHAMTNSSAAVSLALATNPGGGTLGGTRTVNAVNGIATFNNLSLTRAGSGYSLAASGAGLTGATSTTFSVSPAAISALAFGQQPADTPTGQDINPPVTVLIEDAYGNLVNTATNAVTIALGANPGGGTLSGTLTVNANNGVASFDDLTLTRPGAGYTLTASSGSLTGATSNPFTVEAVAAALQFVQQPTNVAAGVAINPAITVQVVDSFGNPVTDSSAPVTLALGTNSGGAKLGGTLTVNAVNGLATFSDITLNRTGSGYTLSASSGTLTGAASAAFNVTPAVPSQLQFVQQPAGGVAGSAPGTVTVEVLDSLGNEVTNSSAAITLALGSGPSGATLGGTRTVNAVNGLATFSNLSLTQAGTGYTLSASSTGLTGATSQSFNVTPATAAAVQFVQQPSDVQISQAISPAVTVAVVDAYGNVVDTNAAVTVALGANPGGGTLGGTLTVNAVHGIATFGDLTLKKVGSGYTLVATSGSFTATSNGFTVTPAPASLVQFVQQPTDGNVGQAISPAVTVQLMDAYGDVVDTNAAVTLALGTNPGGATLSGTLTVNAAHGIATFSDLALNLPGSGYTLVASSGSLTTATSAAFNQTLAPAPDLLPTGLALTPAHGLQSGGSLTVSWNDSNIGNLATASGFYDKIVLVNTTTGQTLNAVNLYYDPTLAGNGPIGPGQSRARSYTFTLPDGVAGVGTLTATVTLDATQVLPEANAQGTGRSNDTTTTNFTSTLANYADLTVQAGSLTVLQPSSVQSGDQVTVGWNDQNIGNAAVSSGYTDYVLVQRVNADNSLTYIASGTVAGNSSLGVNATSPETFSFTLPDGPTGTGDIRISVTADYYQSVKEYDASGNPAYGNNATSLDVTSTLAPYPDLVVQSFGIPANGAPNQPLTLTWSDANQGTKAVPSNASWDDQVYLADDPSGTNKQLLQTFFLTGGIAAAQNGTPGTVSHTGAVTLPMFVQGNKYILITTGINESGFYDLRTTNQTTASSNTVYIPPSLLVGLSTHSVPVNASDPDMNGHIPVALTGTVTRTDGTTGALTVTLSAANLTSSNTEVSFPATTVTIPDGQASTTFAVDTVDNRGTDTVQGPQQVQISAAATGHISGSDTVTVTDATVPALTLTVDNDMFSQDAGNGAATGTVTRDTNPNDPNLPNGGDLTVYLSSSDNNWVTVPQSVTIPAGQASATFPINAINDHLIEGTRNVKITASTTATDTLSGKPFANGYVEVMETDANSTIPNLTLNLGATQVTKNTPNPATIATITLNPINPQEDLTIDLHSSNVMAISVPSMVMVPAGASSVTFPVTVVNDGMIDGTQTVTVTANVSDTIHGFDIAQGGTSQTIQVLDTMGPTLSVNLNSSSVAEGGQTTATVSLNTGPAASDVTVSLQSSDTTLASVPATVTIPAGQTTSAPFLVTSLVNSSIGTAGASVTISASTTATYTPPSGTPLSYNPGAATLNIINGNLPDLVVTNITTPFTGLLTDAQSPFSWTVANNGLVATPSGATWTDDVYLSGDQSAADGTLIASLPVPAASDPLAVGASYTQNSALVTWPDTPGTYYLIVVADAGNQLTEMDKRNNMLVSAPIVIAPAYTATVNVASSSKTVPQGSPVYFSGQAIDAVTGKPAPYQDVVVQVQNSAGTIRTIKNKYGLNFQTDSNGNFQGVFTPLPTEAGSYQIAAMHPGTATFTAQDTFNILGMSFADSRTSATVVPGTPANLSLNLTNLSPVDLHDLSFSVVGAPSNLSVQITSPANGSTLAGSATVPVQLVFNATGTQTSQGRIGIKVTSAEGVSAAEAVDVSIAPAQPQLVANPGFLNTGMVVGQQSSVSFTVTNTGGAPTDDLTVELPSNAPYLGLASSSTIPSLAPGQSATLTLLLNPAADLPPQEYQGNIVLVSDRTSLSENFTLRAVSTAVGQLQVTVIDENTVYAANKPNVANAQVSVLDPYTGAVIAQGTTDSTGILTLTNVNQSDTANYGTTNISAGTYNVLVTAAKHDPFRGSVTIVPGTLNTLQAYVHMQTVTYNWKVVPTEEADTYKIALEATFETNVPAPVVTVDNPFIIPVVTQGEDTEIDLSITNHGLIAANNVTISVPVTPGFIFSGAGVGDVSVATDGSLEIRVGNLPAMSSIVVPVNMRVADNVVLGQDVATQAIKQVFGPVLKQLGLPNDNFSASSVDLSNGKIPCFPKINVLYTFECVGNELQAVPVNLAPVCVGQKIFKCIQQALKGAGAANGLPTESLGDAGKLGKAACGIILSCINFGLSDCTKALIKAACGITAGALTGGLAGAGSGLANSLTDLLKCFCNLSLPDLGTGPPPPPPDILDGIGIFRGGGGSGDGIARSYTVEDGWVDLPICGSGGGSMSVAPIVGASYARAANSPDPALAVPGNLSGATITPESSGSATAQDAPGSVMGVCATVRIQIDQQAVLTRDAFIGTLEIDNGGDAISNLQVSVNFTTPSSMDMGMSMGTMAANDDFAYGTPLQTNITGSVVDGTGAIAQVAADGTATAGTVQYTFIPTDMAAMNGVTTYYVGGTFTYTQDGEQITVPILPATIEVLPQPKLVLNYFLQKDVIGDDPFTPQVEPSEPFSLGLQVTNEGLGEAHDFTITTAQPQIVENEKGLLINFQIIGTQIGGKAVTPSLTADLGTIAAGATQTAQFIMLSSLQGRFTSYSATFQHVDDLGNKDTSLIQSVNIHEMIHVAKAGYVGNPSNAPVKDDGVPDFLTNDIPDPDHLPDTLWLSNGTQAPVSQSINVNVTADSQALTYDLSASDSQGWNYLQVEDPTNGQYQLSQVVRSDGLKIIVGANASNAWITDRTFSNTDSSFTRDNVFHLLDYAGTTGTYTYKLIYTKLDNVPPTITTVVPIEPNTRSTPVSSETVSFSKSIASFPLSALTLTRNGGANLIPGSGVTITATDSTNKTFTINGLSALSAAPGSYKLIIDPTQVEDTSQNFGTGAPVELDWVVDTTHAVATIAQVTPNVRNTSVGAVNVTFSRPINPASFTTSALSLMLAGSSTNLISSAVSISENGTSGTSFTITGLDGLTQANGTYTLSVDATKVSDLGNNPGVGMDMTTWVMDTVAPTITSLQQPQTPRNIVVPHLTVTFSKPIDPSTFTTAALTLTRTDSNGTSGNLINEFTDPQRAVTIALVPGTTSTYQISNINWPQGLAGTYTLTVNGAAIQDPAGNAVSGSVSATWTISLTAPAAPTNLSISPDTGISSSDGLTNTESITLSGYVAAPGMRVEVLDETENDDFGGVYSATTPSTAPDGTTGYYWSKALTLDAPGDNKLRAQAVDAAQNASPAAYFDVFVDLTQPTVSAMGALAAMTTTPVSTETVTFSKKINPATLDYRALSLTLHDGSNLITSAVTLTPTDSSDTQFTISGLGTLDTAAGNYVLTVDPTGIQDWAGNTGAVFPNVTMNSVSWTESKTGTAPPTSMVEPFPGEVLPNPLTIHTTSFTVSWMAQDNSGSGIAHVNIYVSDNGGPFTLWKQEPASAMMDTYVGVEQHTYGFVSQAVDNAGDVESLRTTADASVFLSIQGQIRGRVFEDVNQTGMDKATDPGLKGWTVFLDLQNDGHLDPGDPSTTTDASGNFVFSGLEPGTYTVGEIVQPGWQLTFPGGGSGSSVKEMTVSVGAADASVSLDNVPAPAGAASSTAANQALIGLNQFRADPRFSGVNGQGYTVVVLDSGVDVSNPYFGPVGSNGVAGGIAYQYDFVDNTASAPDLLGHGTLVASIIGSRDASNPGVAPGVQIIDLKVLDAKGNGDFSNVDRALQWVADNAARYNIVAVNMSFGDGGDYTRPMSMYGLGDVLAELAQENVIAVSAAGNNFYSDHSVPGLAYPAADPNALAVGAVWGSNLGGPVSWSNGAVDYTTAADQIMSFSQRDAALGEVFAPGAFIAGARPGGGVATLSGTSMAAPAVTGVAVLADQLAMQALGRRLTPAEFRYLLATTSAPIKDDGSGNVRDTGLTYHRVDVEALAEGILALKDHPIPPTLLDPAPQTHGGTFHASGIPAGEQQVNLNAGAVVTGVDFGNFLPGRVSGTVYLDSNGNGQLDSGEAGLSGWTVTLHANNGSAPDQTYTTGASGAYSFAGLAAGTYTLSETRQSGYRETQPGSASSLTYTFTVTSEFTGTFNFGNQVFAAPTGLGISPDTGRSATDGITDTGSVTFFGTLGQTGLTVHLVDLTTGTDLGDATVSETSFSANLTLAEGSHRIQATATDSAGNVSAPGIFTMVVDLTAPTSQVSSLPARQSSLTFNVPVTFSDPAGAAGAPSGVALVTLYVNDTGPDGTSTGFYTTAALTQAVPGNPASGSVTFTFTGKDRHSYTFHAVAQDAAGNTESKSSTAIEASTYVPDLTPPVTHVLTTSSYTSQTGVFTLNYSGQDGGDVLKSVTVYVTVDGGAAQVVNTLTSNVYSGSTTYAALADGNAHTYGFYSLGTDASGLVQPVPSAPDVSFTETYTAPLAVTALKVVQRVAQPTLLQERSYIRVLEVDFNQSPTANAPDFLTNLGKYVEVLYFGTNGTQQGTVSLSNATVTLSGASLFIDFGVYGITSALTLSGGQTVSQTSARTSTFGDGWYGLGVSKSATGTGNPIWSPFFRLLGNATGAPASGNPTVGSADVNYVSAAVGKKPLDYNADINGDGYVNQSDVSLTKLRQGDTAGSAPTTFPQFQLFAGPAGSGGAAALTESQVQVLLPTAIAAWHAAGLTGAGVQLLERSAVLVADLGSNVLGLEAAGVIWINQTAAGHDWYVNWGSTADQPFGATGPGGERLAAAGTAAAGQVALLTVLEHELGHVLGLQDNNQAGDLMDTTLGLGESRGVSASDVSELAPSLRAGAASGGPLGLPGAAPAGRGLAAGATTVASGPLDRSLAARDALFADLGRSATSEELTLGVALIEDRQSRPGASPVATGNGPGVLRGGLEHVPDGSRGASAATGLESLPIVDGTFDPRKGPLGKRRFPQ
jgi:uncharacterized membrane protein